MLILLLLFALIRTLRGVPLVSPLDDTNGFPALDIRDTSSHFGERAVSDIVLSCFATIFACTWSAVHPNIPAPTDCAWTRFKRQVLTMVYALLAPEAVTAWALRQRLAARTIVHEYNERIATYKNPEKVLEQNSVLNTIRALFHDSPLPPKLKAAQVPEWTLAHGFFLQMGGFLLSEDGQPTQTLTYKQLELDDEKVDIKWNIEKGIINPPSTTEEDIQDRSKGDAISKTLIILQTTWFIAQCIARWSSRLPVTELEVVTLGFAMLNGITYALWWHKPQNVGWPVFLEIKHKSTDESSNVIYEHSSVTEKPGPRPTAVPEDSETQDLEFNGIPSPFGALSKWEEENNPKLTPSKQSYLRRKSHKDIAQHAHSNVTRWKLLYLIPLRLIQGLLRPLSKLAEYSRLFVNSSDLRVPMFYSAGVEDSAVYGLTTLIGVLFGLVHLMPSWFIAFASVQEMWLWRVSAIVITGGPVFLGLWQYSRPAYMKDPWYLYKQFEACLIGMIPIYIISRIILLTLALTSLRALPPGALQTVDWTTFIPHL